MLVIIKSVSFSYLSALKGVVFLVTDFDLLGGYGPVSAGFMIIGFFSHVTSLFDKSL
jgi:hypothetical protein